MACPIEPIRKIYRGPALRFSKNDRKGRLILQNRSLDFQAFLLIFSISFESRIFSADGRNETGKLVCLIAHSDGAFPSLFSSDRRSRSSSEVNLETFLNGDGAQGSNLIGIFFASPIDMSVFPSLWKI
jgi:hypothetical protein